MSSIYILEPPTQGKVLLKTSVGDIDIELWSKETPQTCRNFIQLCLEGYYNNTIFHRVIRGFIAQGGDPKGDGTGGESIYGEPFKDEFHQRLRFVRRGLLAMANAGKDDNSSQFFFTLGAAPELQNKHTIFGKVTGDTVFNMLKLEEGVIKNERPEYPHKIIKAEVLLNPFSDIEPRVLPLTEVKEKKKKEKQPGVKNFKLLSFGAEAEEDEEEATRVNEKLAGKGKSTHDILDDPKLSSQTEETVENPDDNNDDEVEEVDAEGKLESIRKKLKRDHKKNKNTPVASTATNAEPMDTYQEFLDEEKLEKRKKKFEEIKQEIDSVKKEYHKNKLQRDKEKTEELKKHEKEDETVQEYKSEFDKYKSKNKALPKKGAGREQFTLQLLEKFKSKLQNVKEKLNDEEKKDEKVDEEETWLTHRLSFQEKTPILAKDANKKDDDWFEIYDPRSALNKRRRGEDAAKFKK